MKTTLLTACLAPILLLTFACASFDNESGSNSASELASDSASGAGTELAKPAPYFDSWEVGAVDMEKREELMGAIRNLEGLWKADDMGHSDFEVSSGGSVVREIMNPGEAMEMTNMYSMDGNDLRLVHYCGIGNQPHMRASGINHGENGSSIVFEPDGVTDLKSPEQSFMGKMTLHLVDENHIEQHWISIANGVAGEPMVIPYQRVD